MFDRIRQIIIKELIQVLRNKASLFLLLATPMIQILITGYAVTFEVKHLATAVLDLDNSQESRELISHFSGSRYFEIRARVSDQREIAELINRGKAMVALHIDHGFANHLQKGETAQLQVILDGSNSNVALVALGYVNQITSDFARDYQSVLLQRNSPLLAAQLPRIVLERRPLFNDDMQSRWNFIPGVIGILTLIQVLMLTAFAVVREREIGTLEQVMVTPLRRWEFIVGKTLPFFLIGLADGVLIAIVATVWFRIPFRGSVGVLALGLVLFLLCVLSAGLLLSTVSRTQGQALLSAFFFNQPAVVFSGFAFPITSIPPIVRWLTYLDPLRYFEVVLRSVYLKGVGLSVLWPQMVAMAIFAPVLLTISVLRFRKSLD